jgi:hypothetical protein
MTGETRLEKPIAAIAAKAKHAASHIAPGNPGWRCSKHTPSAKPNAANLIASRRRPSSRD